MSAQPKKAANLTVRADLLEEARARKINLSQTLETALTAELKKQREAEWLEQNWPDFDPDQIAAKMTRDQQRSQTPRTPAATSEL